MSEYNFSLKLKWGKRKNKECLNFDIGSCNVDIIFAGNQLRMSGQGSQVFLSVLPHITQWAKYIKLPNF